LSIQIGIIGGGVMAEAILSRLITVGAYTAGQMLISDPLASRCHFLEEQYGVLTTNQNQKVVQAPTVLLAIKPQVWLSALQDLTVPADRLIISILAGVTIGQLEQVFTEQAVIRTMPNTPATVGEGITAIARGSRVSAAQYQVAAEIFQTVGKVVSVSESQLDAVTGLSGSGPAYVAIMVEALADGGVAAGLPRATAQELALQTVLGTAYLLAETGLHPALCKDRVTSPGGTTIAGIRALEQGGFRSTIIEAVIAATDRSRELSS
jgi:pyrroline-5-carboxylate reductase